MYFYYLKEYPTVLWFFNVEIYDTNQHSLFPNEEDDTVSPMTLIPKASNVAVVMQCGGIWFANGKIDVGFSTFKYFGRRRYYSFPMLTYLLPAVTLF